MHDDVAVIGPVDAHPELPQGDQRRQAILALEKSMDVGRAVGKAAQHQSTMRDRLVAGNSRLAVNVAARLRHVARYCGRLQDTARG